MSNVIDPIELLTNKGDRQLSFLNKTFNPIACTALGFLMGAFINWGFRKPAFSGIHQHIGLAVGGGTLGLYLDRKRNEYLAKRDAVLRHYVELHPEDFPPIERKKIGDTLDLWVPIR